MTLLYYDPVFRQHQTGRHPERPLRVERIWEHLAQTGWNRLSRPEWNAATREQIQRVHDGAYTRRVEAFCEDGGGQIEADTVCSEQSYRCATRAAGAVCDAVQRVLSDQAENAFCIVRPPGHHAVRSAPMGFCLLNSIAIAAAEAIHALQLDRVLIVDWDVHHGNGTQDAFYADEQIGFFSSHRFPFYPGSGAADETGIGAGLGATCNLPLSFGVERREILSRLASELEEFANRTRPQLVLLSAGFDAHRDDPVGSLGLETEDFGELTSIVQDVARSHCQGRLVSVLEGGYNVDVLGDCVEQHLKRLHGDPPPAAD